MHHQMHCTYLHAAAFYQVVKHSSTHLAVYFISGFVVDTLARCPGKLVVKMTAFAGLLMATLEVCFTDKKIMLQKEKMWE